MENKSFLCTKCDKNYTRYSSLVRHNKKNHPNEISLKNENFKFECTTCGKKYKSKACLLKHYRTTHGKKTVIEYFCPLCKEKITQKTFILHCQDVHDISIEIVELDFSSFEEFKNWKQREEESTLARYIRIRSEKKNKDGVSKICFKCHRSGFFATKGIGLRRLKTKGSCKINGYCPAGIKLLYKSNKQCHVFFTKTHLGHQADIDHANLSSKQKALIASKLASKVSFDSILDEVKDSIGNNFERIYYLSRQDLYNIERSFNLKSSTVRHENGGTGVDEWVKQMESREIPCILFYKSQGTVCENYIHLLKDDFILVIMNNAQNEILKKYGNYCICIDETHGLNNNFQLTTILVLDDMHQCFPCAFLFSNRSDEYILSLFFQCIKNKCGIIAPHIFISNISEDFSIAWSAAMDQPKIKFYNTWDIDRAWRENLNRITSQEKQLETYKLLRVLLEEVDTGAFIELLESTIKELENLPETVDFAIYFKENYVKNPATWANCYKVNAGINTNMYIEQIHKTLEYICLKGKNIKQLEKTVNVIMLFVRDQLSDRLIIINNGQLTHKLNTLKKRHKASLTMSNQIIQTENGWSIQSNSSRETYLVVKNLTDCICKLMCNECSACLHKYSCSCADYSIKWNMCKHIHYVISSNICKTISVVEDSIDSQTNIADTGEIIEYEIITEEFQNSGDMSNYLEGEKKALKQEMSDIIDLVSSPEELEAIKKLIQPMRPTIEAYHIMHNLL